MAPRTIHRMVLAGLALLMLAVVMPASALGVVRFDRQWPVAAGNGTEGGGVAVDRTGSVVYVADPNARRLRPHHGLRPRRHRPARVRAGRRR